MKLGGMSDDNGVPEAWPTRDSTVVEATPDNVMAVISDFPGYPEWSNSIRVTEVLTTGSDGNPSRVRFELLAGAIADEYVLVYSWSEDGRGVEWQLESSTLQSSQHGSYRLEPVAGGTRVDYELEIELAVPVIGSLRTRAERRILGDALSELKRRAEAR
ncbi:cyclase [Dietzia sp. NCCP-2495]|nr:cyclase [Dietzia sp. NCCP-2495]